MDALTEVRFDIFATCPHSGDAPGPAYLEEVKTVARWSEETGCRGILVYTQNSMVDPWLVSQTILQNTKELSPLVAVQPAYMHPYSAAKMTGSLTWMYGRRLFLNMVAGGFVTDLAALGDATPHDARYAKLVEYAAIINLLSGTAEPVEFAGDFYTIKNLRMIPPLPPELAPGIFVSGSSEAGLAAAKALGATAIRYPKPAGEYGPSDTEELRGSGIRVGIIVREDAEEAWRIAHERFPSEDRKGRLTHKLAMKISDSQWHKQLSDIADREEAAESPYWLVPFTNYRSFCPYLVGDHDTVSDELALYAAAGYGTYILDIPPTQDELVHAGETFRRAARKAAALKLKPAERASLGWAG